MKGEISDIENLGTVVFIHIQRSGLKHLWDRVSGIEHTIPVNHRMFDDIVNAEGELIGRQIEFDNETIYFSNIDPQCIDGRRSLKNDIILWLKRSKMDFEKHQRNRS